MHCPPASESAAAFSLVRRYSATELPSGTGELRGEARVALEGTSHAGTLTFGPYSHLPPGSYRVTVHYSERGASNPLDISGVDGSGPSSIATGVLPDTAGQPSTFSATFRLPAPTDAFEVRTYFSGSGELSVTAITIDRRTVNSPVPPR
jgi:hypothetical protein